MDTEANGAPAMCIPYTTLTNDCGGWRHDDASRPRRARGLRWGHSWKEEDRVADYVERMDEQQDERQPVFDILTRLVQAEPDAPLRILDIGTGYGPVATACLDAFPNATAVGLDVSRR